MPPRALEAIITKCFQEARIIVMDTSKYDSEMLALLRDAGAEGTLKQWQIEMYLPVSDHDAAINVFKHIIYEKTGHRTTDEAELASNQCRFVYGISPEDIIALGNDRVTVQLFFPEGTDENVIASQLGINQPRTESLSGRGDTKHSGHSR